MASSKKRRKEARQAKKRLQPRSGLPFRHRDGDRRRRHEGAVRVEDAIALKHAMQQIGPDFLPVDQGEEEE
jgi:hypothetical protein